MSRIRSFIFIAALVATSLQLNAEAGIHSYHSNLSSISKMATALTSDAVYASADSFPVLNQTYPASGLPEDEFVYTSSKDKDEESKGCFDCSWINSGFEITGRAAAFIPIFEKPRKVYGEAWGDYQLEISQSFHKVWSVWAGAQYAYKTSHTRSACTGCIRAKTKIHVWPLSFGLKYNCYFDKCTDIYFGAGVAYTFLRIHDHWPYVREHTSKGGVGALFKLGAKHYFTRLFFAEVFADYLLQRFHFHNSHSGPFVERNNLYLDALLLGGGVGLNF